MKKPAFTLIAVVTLALGIGANTAIFSMINTLFLQYPGAVDKPDQLVSVIALKEGRLAERRFSYADYADYRDQNTVFSETAAQGMVWIYISTGADSTEVPADAVSSNYFSLLGVK